MMHWPRRSTCRALRWIAAKHFLENGDLADFLLPLLIWKYFLRIHSFCSSVMHKISQENMNGFWREDALAGTLMIYCAETSALVVGLHSLKLWSRCPPLCCFPTGTGAQSNEWWLGFCKGSFPEEVPLWFLGSVWLGEAKLTPSGLAHVSSASFVSARPHIRRQRSVSSS